MFANHLAPNVQKQLLGNPKRLQYILSGLLLVAILAQVLVRFIPLPRTEILIISLGTFSFSYMLLGSSLMGLPQGRTTPVVWSHNAWVSRIMEVFLALTLGFSVHNYLQMVLMLTPALSPFYIQLALLGVVVGILGLNKGYLPESQGGRRGHALQLLPWVVVQAPVVDPYVDRGLTIGLFVVGVLLYDRGWKGFGLHGQLLALLSVIAFF